MPRSLLALLASCERWKTKECIHNTVKWLEWNLTMVYFVTSPNALLDVSSNMSSTWNTYLWNVAEESRKTDKTKEWQNCTWVNLLCHFLSLLQARWLTAATVWLMLRHKVILQLLVCKQSLLSLQNSTYLLVHRSGSCCLCADKTRGQFTVKLITLNCNYGVCKLQIRCWWWSTSSQLHCNWTDVMILSSFPRLDIDYQLSASNNVYVSHLKC